MKELLDKESPRIKVENVIKTLKKPFLKRILKVFGETSISKNRLELQKQVLQHSNEDIINAYNSVLKIRHESWKGIKDFLIEFIIKILSQKATPIKT